MFLYLQPLANRMISKKLLIGSMIAGIAAMLAVPFGVAESVAPCMVINGDHGDNNLIGTSGCDKINGDDGNDDIFPGDGADRVNAGDGDDFISNLPDGDRDIINCEGGDDSVYVDGNSNTDGDLYRNCENIA